MIKNKRVKLENIRKIKNVFSIAFIFVGLLIQIFYHFDLNEVNKNYEKRIKNTRVANYSTDHIL